MSGIAEMMKAVENVKKRKPAKIDYSVEAMEFIQQIDSYLVDLNIKRRDSYKPKNRYFKPSSISKCKRELYYYFTGVPEEAEDIAPQNQRILDLGSVVHEQMQEQYLRKISEEFSERNVLRLMTDDEVARVVPKETDLLKTDKTIEVKFFSNKYNIKGFTDGMLYFKGNYHIFEFKTIKHSLFTKLKAPKPEHIEQATTYSLALGLDKVIFLYYSKDTSSLKCFFTDITDEMKQNVIDKITTMNGYLEREEMPPKEYGKCRFCRYKKTCMFEGVHNG